LSRFLELIRGRDGIQKQVALPQALSTKLQCYTLPGGNGCPQKHMTRTNPAFCITAVVALL